MTIQESALRVTATLDSGDFPENLEPQYVAWLLHKLAALKQRQSEPTKYEKCKE